ncbi:MAG: 3-phosphoshikimate 1-carboxyvinyltransferase [Bacteroidota bacterium]|jgi:3-phosphoshikimate 1-carboxyvinyltransferase
MQRELLLSLLANSPSRLNGNFIALPDDVLSAIKCIESIGATVLVGENRIEVIPPINPIIKDELTVYVGESGFLIRNIISIGFLYARKLLIHAKGTLLTRELHMNEALLTQLGLIQCSNPGEWPLVLDQIHTCQNHIQLDASATSQIATGVLIRLSKSEGERSLRINNLVSTPYLEMTVDNLMNRGVKLSLVDNCISFDENCQIKGRDIQIEGDWSGAANLLCIGAITNEVRVRGLRIDSNQADENILDILALYGAQIEWNGDVITVRHSKNRSFNCDVTDSPDLFPLLCILASTAKGTSIIKGTKRLLFKESDRLKSSLTMLSSLGVTFETGTNEIQITGGIKNHEPYIDTYNDHRIVLAAIVASTISDLRVSLSEVDSVEKSFPEMKPFR